MYKYIENANQLLVDLNDTYNLTNATYSFYTCRINKFFEEYMGDSQNENKPLDAITYYDVNEYFRTLECSSAQKLNHYQSLKRFFDFSYLSGKTQEIMSRVTKPEHDKPEPEYIKDEHFDILCEFINNRDNCFEERLLLALFLYTGLSRNYISSLRNSQFEYYNGMYQIKIWKDEKVGNENLEKEYIIPLKAQLQLLVAQQVDNAQKSRCSLDKVFDMNENYMSTKIKNLSERIVEKKYTPTAFSNTFIKKCLEQGNRIWEVSKLLLEDIGTIQKHVIEKEDLYTRQMSIINGF